MDFALPPHVLAYRDEVRRIIAETITPDASGNRSNAHWCDVDSRGMLVVSEDPSHLIATVGCDDLVIVHTKDATLICPRAQSERVKELVERIPEKWR